MYIVNPGDFKDCVTTDSYSTARELLSEARAKDPFAAMYYSDGKVLRHWERGSWCTLDVVDKMNVQIKVLKAAGLSK